MNGTSKTPSENNWEYCKRIADAVPVEALVRELLAALSKRDPQIPLWALVGRVTGHGSGVSQAIVERFIPNWLDYEGR